MKRSWSQRLDLALQGLAVLLVTALLATVTAGVVSRALNRPLSWTDEASGFLMVWLACSGWMIATRRGAHIRIRFFMDRAAPSVQRGSEVLIQLAMLLLGAVVAWKSVHLVMTNSDVEAMTLPISTAWMYAALWPAGVLTSAQALVDLVWPRRAMASETGPEFP